MLISRRKEGETLLIGEGIEVRVIAVRGKKVTLGVIAPREMKIAAGKLSAAAIANTLAATHSASLDLFLGRREEQPEKPVSLLQGFPKKPAPNDR